MKEFDLDTESNSLLFTDVLRKMVHIRNILKNRLLLYIRTIIVQMYCFVFIVVYPFDSYNVVLCKI
jgi:hypothetical protein